MERSPTRPSEEKEEEKVKVSSESPKKAIFYIYHPSHFLQQLLRSLFKCLGFHEISVTNKEYSKSLNPLSGGAGHYPAGCNNPSDQDDVVPCSPSPQASDLPTSTAADQEIGTSAIARRRPGRPGPTPGPGPQTN